MVQQIDIEINDYSEKLGLSDVKRTIESAVDDFPNLSSRIDKLYVFIFNSKQIEEGIDIEKMRPLYKFIIVFVVLTLAFVTTTLLSIIVAVNLSVPVQNSNRKLDNWITDLENKGYHTYYRRFDPATSTVKAKTFTDFNAMLADHEVTEVYWMWTSSFCGMRGFWLTR